MHRYLFNSSQCHRRRGLPRPATAVSRGQSAAIYLAIDARRFRPTVRRRYSDSAAAQVARHIRQIEINMFRGGTRVAAPQLTESSRPGSASGFAVIRNRFH